jgi:hypothetical protein
VRDHVNVSYLNYKDHPDFANSDFRNSDHLNTEGAQKLTHLLNMECDEVIKK